MSALKIKEAHDSQKTTPDQCILRIAGYSDLFFELGEESKQAKDNKFVPFRDDDLMLIAKTFSKEQLNLLAAAVNHMMASSSESKLTLEKGGTHFWDPVYNRLVTPATTLAKLRRNWVRVHQEQHRKPPRQQELLELEQQMDKQKENLAGGWFWNFIGMGRPDQPQSETSSSALQQVEQDNSNSVVSSTPGPTAHFSCHGPRNWEDDGHLNAATIWDDTPGECFSSQIHQVERSNSRESNPISDANKSTIPLPSDTVTTRQLTESFRQPSSELFPLSTGKLEGEITDRPTLTSTLTPSRPRLPLREQPGQHGFAEAARQYKNLHEDIQRSGGSSHWGPRRN